MACYNGVALIVAAGCDLGEAVARAFIEAGCRRLILADNDRSALEGIKALLDTSHADVRIVQRSGDGEDDFEGMVSAAAACFSAVNYCVNCSGIINSAGIQKPTAEMDASDFKAGLDGSSREMWLSCRAEMRLLLKQGCSNESPNIKNSIVNIVPYGALGSHAGHAVQAASGYQRIGITKSIARDHLKDGIRVNAVCPSLTNSKEDRSGNDEVLEQHIKLTGRVIEVKEVANAAVFLAGELGQGINGVSLPVDYGWSMMHS